MDLFVAVTRVTKLVCRPSVRAEENLLAFLIKPVTGTQPVCSVLRRQYYRFLFSSDVMIDNTHARF